MDSSEFSTLWKEVENYLSSYLRLLIFSPTEREEVLQNTALAAWRKIDTFEASRASFKTWSAGIARFESLRFMRMRKMSKISFDSEFIDKLDLCAEEENSEIDAIYENLAAVIAELSSQKQNILKLRYSDNKSFAEIGASLDMSEAAVKEKVYRIKGELREALEKLRKSENKVSN